MRELGVNHRLQAIAFLPNGMSRSYEERARLLDEYKGELKKVYRKVALECHPDRTQGLPEEERCKKEERFKRISAAVDFVMSLSPRPPQQSRALHAAGFRIIVVQHASSTGSWDTSTTSGSGWPAW